MRKPELLKSWSLGIDYSRVLALTKRHVGSRNEIDQSVVKPLFTLDQPIEMVDKERLKGTNHKTIQFTGAKKNFSSNSRCRKKSHDCVSQTLPRITQYINACLERTPYFPSCIQRTLVRVPGVSAQYRFHCKTIVSRYFCESSLRSQC